MTDEKPKGHSMLSTLLAELFDDETGCTLDEDASAALRDLLGDTTMTNDMHTILRRAARIAPPHALTAECLAMRAARAAGFTGITREDAFEGPRCTSRVAVAFGRGSRLYSASQTSIDASWIDLALRCAARV